MDVQVSELEEVAAVVLTDSEIGVSYRLRGFEGWLLTAWTF